ncbi:MAG: succinyl-diaminopimelate desuccinylase [Gammaproteobacteria bacterium]|nr:MAG: succinyl-diaminopimelate desuccinylase [Gammaproteobacteria bacterium]
MTIDLAQITADTLALSRDLIQRPSVTPKDEGCQALMIERLEAIGFTVKKLRFGDVDNFWATHGQSQPRLVFAGHTDVVPTGDVDEWTDPPFDALVKDGFLYGRGSADMKGSLAAMVTACERFVKHNPNHQGTIGFLITSDEEGPATNGTVKVVQYLQDNNIPMDWCIVGEPSSTEHPGDIIKNGRRGSLGAVMTIQGKQGHVAYPHLAKNPIHLAAPALAELSQQTWDQGNEYFPPTSFQISNIHSGTGATNVIPGKIEVVFNFRFSTESDQASLEARTNKILDQHGLDYHIEWNLSGLPFLTEPGELVKAAQHAIKKTNGISTELSTAGGTSDGRFIAPTGTQVIEIGPVNSTIHQVDECVKVTDLGEVSSIYEIMLEQLLPTKA